MVDTLWELKVLPNKSQLHAMFYERYREKGYRAHVIRNMYSKAKEIVKSALKNGTKGKPKLKRLTSEFDVQDVRVNLEKGEVKVVFKSKRFLLKLKHRKDYVRKFLSYKWKMVHVSYKSGKFYVSVVFEVNYNPYYPQGIMSLDVNLRQLVSFDGSKVRRYSTAFVKALSLKAKAEELQRRYSKRWRYNEKILQRIRGPHKRSSNVITD